MRGFITTSALAVLLAFTAAAALSQTTNDLIFIHHSCGENWLNNSLDAALRAKSYIDERNDITYGTTLSPDSGRPASLGDIPGDNTNMNHWILWFNDYLEGVKTHGCASGTNTIIMFKSCYPISNVDEVGTEPGSPFSDGQSIVNYKAVYRNPNGSGETYSNDGYAYKALEDVFAANPNVLFIPVTSPSCVPRDTNVENADRARQFNNWLKGEWLSGYKSRTGLNNVAVFDWFDFLANPDDAGDSERNMTKDDYRTSNSDSHPNEIANAASTKVFATDEPNFIDAAWEAFNGSTPQYALTMTVSPDGAGTTSPTAGSHDVSGTQTITATAATGYYFVSWTATDNATITDSSSDDTTVILSGDATVTANFAAVPATASLTMAVSPEGAGATTPTAGTQTVNTLEAIDISAEATSGYVFSAWTVSGAASVADATSASTTVTLSGDATVTAVFTVIADAIPVTVGSLLTVTPADLVDFEGDSFPRQPKAFGVYNDPVKGRDDVRVNMKVFFGGDGSTSFQCEWTKATPLFNKKDIDKSETTETYLAGLTGGVIAPVECGLRAVATDVSYNTSVYEAGDLEIVPPTITGVFAADGTTIITSAGPGDAIVIKGTYFGAKPPNVWLEYVKKSQVKPKKCKVDKTKLSYKDARGKSCCMDVDAESATYGASSLTVILPKKWPNGWNVESSEHNIVIDNKVGRATYDFTTDD